ncbi:MAG TPA: hypothetical protein IAC14_07730 [Candidatus Scybalomonas excrementigallinarum]|nr:hypothetical protein [Candidatus Scybalomonas excrementigallinarum]
MSPYSYTLYPKKKERAVTTYRQSELEKMTTFQLREICREERLVVPNGNFSEREEFIHLLMRFRGRNEYQHITDYEEEGLERIQTALQQTRLSLVEDPSIQMPATLFFYPNMEVNEWDQYEVKTTGTPLYEGNILLVDEQWNVDTCFYVKEKEKKFYLCKGKEVEIKPLETKQYFFIYFPNSKESDGIYEIYHNKQKTMPASLSIIKIPLLQIEVGEVKQANVPLVIDFGSSNTTMGVCFVDGSVQIAQSDYGEMIPSVIAITNIQGDKKEFAFGYEAIRQKQNHYLEQEIPIFYDIKRWISDVERKEKILLDNGFPYQVERKEMLKAFFHYLLTIATHQFKCQFSTIQFLTPIRQKEKFATVLKELLPEYEVECDLDEGMAVLFNSIDTLMKKDVYERGRWYEALLIDCGGGTTDLMAGKFCIDNNRISYDIQLETQYENGDTNFGGNNLTFRLLQLLKVKIVNALQAGNEIDEPLIELQQSYERAESIVPTRFKDYENATREQYFFVKNNYYYLFEVAEEIKTSFFQSHIQYELILHMDKDKKQEIENKKRKTFFFDKWRLHIFDGRQFTKIKEPISISFYLYEVEELLRDEIYAIMGKFLEPKFQQGQLRNYDMIKLTGQSCRSRLFTEALKEYVPGRLIQSTKRNEDNKELKLCCLKGALSYFFHHKLGYMKIKQEYDVRTLPYEIMAFTHENKEKVLIHSFDEGETIGCISRFHIGRQLDLYLRDEHKNVLKTYYFTYETSKFSKTTQEEIDAQYAGSVIQEETDIILEGEMKFFVWASKKQWGFYVLPILREGELLYKGEEVFFDFEDDTWEENFFDGRK